MPPLGTAFNWVFVTGGTWTRIWQGPLIQGIPYQALELARTGGSTAMVTWTLDGYSAAPPFYSRTGGTTRPSGIGSAPPMGHIGSYATVISYLLSPWVEFWILPSSGCWAHIAVL